MKTTIILFAIFLSGCAGTSYLDPNYSNRKGNEAYRAENDYLRVIDLSKYQPTTFKETPTPVVTRAKATSPATAGPLTITEPMPFPLVPMKYVSKRVQERLKRIQKILE